MRREKGDGICMKGIKRKEKREQTRGASVDEGASVKESVLSF